ncbi:MAG: hypothetical protein ACKVQU_23695 [Burkholderiales bacterium]
MRHPPSPDDPDTLRGPGGLTLREVHALVRKSVERDEAARPTSTPSRRGMFAGLFALIGRGWRRLRGQ